MTFKDEKCLIKSISLNPKKILGEKEKKINNLIQYNFDFDYSDYEKTIYIPKKSINKLLDHIIV